MGLMENALLKAVRFKLSRDLGMDSLIADIPVEGLREYTDIPYTNRAGKQLFMDILHPEYPESAAVIDEIIDWFRAHE